LTAPDAEGRFRSGEKLEIIAKIKEWLSPTEFDSDTSEYKKHLNAHVQGTGQWILATDQYKQWYETDRIGDLWIRGIPGSGKSVVAASLIRDLKNRGDAPVLFFFFRHIILSNRSPQSLLRDCSFQLLDHSHSLQSSLKQVMKSHSNVIEVPVDELWKCFSSAISATRKVYCVVDALDEMESSHDSFLADLLNLGRRHPSSVKLAVTSRQLPHLEVHLKRSCLVDLRLDRKSVDKDIATYISHRLKNSQVNLSEDQSRGIEEAVCAKGKGLFLYARLMMDQCLQYPAQFISQLGRLPDGLGNMYTDLLHEHATRSGTTESFQRLVLEWVTHSARPLRLLELTAIIKSSPDCGGLELNQDTKMCIRTCCGPLLEFCEDQVIQIIHHSFTEYLLNSNTHHIQITATKTVRFPVLDSSLAHKAIASTCIDYLRSGCFEQWDVTPRNDSLFHLDDEPRSKSKLGPKHDRDQDAQKHRELLLRFHFLDYAAQYWLYHAAKLPDPDADAFKLFDSFMRDESHDFESWKDFWKGLNMPLPHNLSPLHVAAHCGLAAYTEHLLLRGADPNVTDSYQRTPITYAAMEGHDHTLAVLIKHRARFDNPDARGLVPIHHAAKRNHFAALRVLLNSGADPLTAKCMEDPHYDPEYFESTIGETALYYACQYGHVEVLIEILKHLDPSQLVAGPVHWAADKCRAEALTVLLQYEQVRVHINGKDANGNTPLYLAARAKDPATVQVLLNHKADVHARSEDTNVSSAPGNFRRRRNRQSPALRIRKPKSSRTAIHALMDFSDRFNSHGRNVAEIKQVLDLLIDVCNLTSY
jgi:ankyrin repeat protein